MSDPVLTYVTDEDMSRADQERILNAFISCAGEHSLRVAFRLPSWTDSEVQHLVEWYESRIENLGLQDDLEQPVIHDRPEVADLFQNSSLWLPWRNRDLMEMDDIGRAAISVHSVNDAHEAISVGAGELVFGHVFTSESHPGQAGRGINALVELTESIQMYENPPVVTAIGGIDEYTVPELGRIGHSSVACMRTISRSPNIAETLSQIRSGWIAARINATLDENQRTPFGNPSSLFF